MLKETEFLDIFPAFRKGPAALVQQILRVSSRTPFPGQATILTEGDACSSIPFLLSGVIGVVKKTESGREITLYDIEKGGTCILAASSILSNRLYPAEATSITAGESLMLPASGFREMVSKYDAMRDFVFHLLHGRLTATMTLLEEIVFWKMDQRLLEYLSEKSEQGRLVATHQKIASDLGTSREVVSRLLKDFERGGQVVLSGNAIQLKTR